jgi:hypothetical protein
MMLLGVILIVLGFGTLHPISREIASYFTPVPHAIYRSIEWVMVLASCIGGGVYCIMVNSLFR